MTWRERLGIAGLGAGLLAAPLLLADRIARRSVPVTRERERPQSYWMASIPELPSFPPLDRDLQADVLVIGGGFTGLAIAYYVKRADPSRRVAILESHRMGSGASSRNSGGALPHFRGHAQSDESLRGYGLLKQLCCDQNADIELQENVSRLTLHRERSTCANPHLQGDELHRQIGSTFYQAAESGLSNRLHPGKLIAALVAANAELGVEIYEHSPVVQIDRGMPHRVHTDKACVRAQDVAVATNGYTPGLGLARDRLLAMHHRVIVTRPLTDSEWVKSGLEQWPYRVENGGFYTRTVRATPDRRFFYRHVLGHRAFEETSWEFTESDVATGQRELMRRYPWVDRVPIEYEWHGITGRTRDWSPISGQIDDHLYIAAGYNGGGVIASHYFGSLIADCILGIDHAGMTMLRPPAEHPRIPGELLRHIGFQGWIEYKRLRDG